MPILRLGDSDLRAFVETSETFLRRTSSMEVIREFESSADGFDRSWWQQGADLGWLSMLVPEELAGGSVTGDGVLDVVHIAELFGRWVAPGPLVSASAALAGICGSASAERHASQIDEVVRGTGILTWCASGSRDRTAPELRRRGDGYLLTGVVPRVEGAAQADLLLVTARDTQVLVPTRAPGVNIESSPSLDFTRRLGTVSFVDVQVPKEWLVGDEGQASEDIARQRRTALVLQCAESVGAADRVFEFTMEYARDRYSFGRSLASYQALKHRFSDMRTWLEASQGIVAGAAAAAQVGSMSADRLSSAAKAYVGEALPRLLQDCVQMHGGIGVTWEHDIHIYLRRIELNRALYGTPADHRRWLANNAAA